jgi:hypothetical protein
MCAYLLEILFISRSLRLRLSRSRRKNSSSPKSQSSMLSQRRVTTPRLLLLLGSDSQYVYDTREEKDSTTRQAGTEKKNFFGFGKIVEKHLPCNFAVARREGEKEELRNIISNDLTNSLIINSNFVIISYSAHSPSPPADTQH